MGRLWSEKAETTVNDAKSATNETAPTFGNIHETPNLRQTYPVLKLDKPASQLTPVAAGRTLISPLNQDLKKLSGCTCVVNRLIDYH